MSSFSSLFFALYKCDDEYEEITGITCKNEDEIDDFIRNGYMWAYHTQLKIDPTDYEDPFKYFFGGEYTTTHPSYHKDIRIGLRRVEL